MLRVTHNHTGPSSIKRLDLSTRLLQRNISSSPSTPLLTPLSRSIKLSTASTARSSSAKYLSTTPSCTTTPSSSSSLFGHGSKGRFQRYTQRRGFQSSAVNYQSRAIDEFGILGKDGVKGSTGSAASEEGLLSDRILRPHHGSRNPQKMMTLEEAMGDIKPLALNPELTMLKDQATTGAKVIDGKAIAK